MRLDCGITATIDAGIEQRLRQQNCKTVTYSSANGKFEPHDIYRRRRLQPVAQVATISAQSMDYTKSWIEIVKGRLASFVSFLTGK
jgi:hypothetical protein